MFLFVGNCAHYLHFSKNICFEGKKYINKYVKRKHKVTKEITLIVKQLKTIYVHCVTRVCLNLYHNFATVWRIYKKANKNELFSQSQKYGTWHLFYHEKRWNATFVCVHLFIRFSFWNWISYTSRSTAVNQPVLRQKQTNKYCLCVYCMFVIERCHIYSQNIIIFAHSK